MMSQNFLLNEMDRWQKECLDFLINEKMTIEEKTLTRINILSLTHKELGNRVKEVRKFKKCRVHSPWRGCGGDIGKCIHCGYLVKE